MHPNEFLKKNKPNFNASTKSNKEVDLNDYVKKTELKTCDKCEKSIDSSWGGDKPLLYDLYNPLPKMENDFFLTKNIDFSYIDNQDTPLWK